MRCKSCPASEAQRPCCPKKVVLCWLGSRELLHTAWHFQVTPYCMGHRGHPGVCPGDRVDFLSAAPGSHGSPSLDGETEVPGTA